MSYMIDNVSSFEEFITMLNQNANMLLEKSIYKKARIDNIKKQLTK